MTDDKKPKPELFQYWAYRSEDEPTEWRAEIQTAKPMIQQKFKALMYAGAFMDTNLLHTGLYAAHTPYLYPIETTIESLADQFRSNLGETYINGKYAKAYIENLSKCELVEVTLSI